MERARGSGSPLWQRILSILTEKRREEFLAKLTLNVLRNLGAETSSIESCIKISLSAVHASLETPGLLPLLREAPLALQIKTEPEIEWASVLGDYELNVTELDIRRKDAAKYLPELLDLFPKTRTVWLEEDAVIHGTVSDGVKVKRYDRCHQSNILSTRLSSPSRSSDQYLDSLKAAAENAKLTKDGPELELRLGHAEHRVLSETQMDLIIGLAIDALEAGLVRATALGPLVERVRNHSRRRQDIAIKAAGAVITADRRLFAMQSQRAATARGPLRLALSSEHSLYTFVHLLESDKHPDNANLTPQEAYELRQLCIDWNLPVLAERIERILLYEDGAITFATYEEWERD